ncbi:tRNA(fMet)-specific endonuclease VapC [Methylomarinovum caldicuralii]|uniref:Ribonuclease VapC n=1 Tax=Methylomarinovum caldicuralii TaxID=438856 RepID=A0AAU9BU82_9GAMM|nr:type II toxin-antitoxin system VapC family toxin [Methylomarinovum caldicuralii]BCX82503.1 tRNA(fMet)-specific endonuclease VapC [Methylomarinovum caldicuralii]
MAGFRYLLDTNILSHLIRQPQGQVRAHLDRVGEDTLCTSVIVACELRYGAQRSGSERIGARVDALLQILPVLPLEPEVAEHYADIRTHLESKGTPIGHNDLLIAAHARHLKLVMVTHNVREFRRVPGLPVENWIGE